MYDVWSQGLHDRGVLLLAAARDLRGRDEPAAGRPGAGPDRGGVLDYSVV